VWCVTPAMPELGKLRQEDHLSFKADLGCIKRPCLKKNPKRKIYFCLLFLVALDCLFVWLGFFATRYVLFLLVRQLIFYNIPWQTGDFGSVIVRRSRGSPQRPTGQWHWSIVPGFTVQLVARVHFAGGSFSTLQGSPR
jgi:hypothetical protein